MAAQDSTFDPPVPALTFGLEIRFDFGVDKHTFAEYASATGHPRFTTPRIPSTTIDNTQARDLRNQIRTYLVALLNRELPGQDHDSFVEVESIVEPRTADYTDRWHVTYDESVTSDRETFGKYKRLTAKEGAENVRVVGAELVSSVLPYENEQDYLDVLEQFQEDLGPSRKHEGWFEGVNHLHAHFAFRDEPLELAVLKNLFALYGLFEDEIERWHPLSQRDDDVWCRRLRKGYEATQARIIGNLYTPHRFTNAITETSTIEELKMLVAGVPTFDDPHADYTTVNISLARPNKPTTIEFRHAKGTIDPEEIKWWVYFCGSLLRHAHYITAKNFEIWDADATLDDPFSFLEGIRTKSILDILKFPEDGKKYFAKQAEKYLDLHHDAERKLEERLIQKRVEKEDEGGTADGAFDDQLMMEEWYEDALEELDTFRNEDGKTREEVYNENEIQKYQEVDELLEDFEIDVPDFTPYEHRMERVIAYDQARELAEVRDA